MLQMLNVDIKKPFKNDYLSDEDVTKSQQTNKPNGILPKIVKDKASNLNNSLDLINDDPTRPKVVKIYKKKN